MDQWSGCHFQGPWFAWLFMNAFERLGQIVNQVVSVFDAY
jgi:hypothetical protein